MKAKRKVGTERSNYQVKRVEPVMVGSDMQARLFTLAPRDKIPWHCHSECADHYFVLEGTLTIGLEPVGLLGAARSHSVSVKETSICIVDDTGRIVREV